MASELVACDGNTLLPPWWPNQSIAMQDPEGWRIIMVAVGATGTHMPRTVNIRDNRPMKVGSIIARENEGAITIGLCTAVNGYTMNMLQLEEVDRRKLPGCQTASAD